MLDLARWLGLACGVAAIICAVVSTAVLHDPLAFGWMRAAVIFAAGAGMCGCLRTCCNEVERPHINPQDNDIGEYDSEVQSETVIEERARRT